MFCRFVVHVLLTNLWHDCSKSEALDVEKLEEYVAMVKKINDKHLSKASLIVDANDVKQKCTSVCKYLERV